MIFSLEGDVFGILAPSSTAVSSLLKIEISKGNHLIELIFKRAAHEK